MPVANTGENELISERALEEIYGPAWQAAVGPDQGDAMSVMCGYAIVNGGCQPRRTRAPTRAATSSSSTTSSRASTASRAHSRPDAVTAERDAALLNFENGGDGGDIRLTVGAAAGDRGATGSGNDQDERRR